MPNGQLPAQDTETVACIGNKSYNALIEHLVMLTGSATPQGSSTTQNSAIVADPDTSATQADENTPAPDVPGGLASSHTGTSTGQKPPAPQDAIKSETTEASTVVQAHLAGGSPSAVQPSLCAACRPSGCLSSTDGHRRLPTR